jgi:hypothetical protein
MEKIKKYMPWILALFVSFGVFLPSLFFKFSGAAESRHIFEVVGQWLGIGIFEPYGRILIGVAELIASILLMIPATQVFGAILGIGVMSGAITFHLVTPLGVTVRWLENGMPHEDASLFILAVLSFFSCLVIIWLRREKLPFFRMKSLAAHCPEPDGCR